MKAICYGAPAHMKEHIIEDLRPFGFPVLAEVLSDSARYEFVNYRPQVYRGPNGFEVIVAFPDGTAPPETLPAELMPLAKRV